MAKQTQKGTPVVPNFKDVDKAAVQAAMAAVSGGRQDPLKVPKTAKVSEGDKGTWSRWTEHAVIQSASRSVAKSGLLEVKVMVKLRQSADNNGRRVFGNFYINLKDDLSDGHEMMNERSLGAITTLLVATGFMPAGGSLKGTLLDKMFPMKNQPGTSSPINGKAVIVSVVQEFQQQKDFKTGKLVVDDEGNKVMVKRDSAESFLPEAKAAVEADDETEGEGDSEEA